MIHSNNLSIEIVSEIRDNQKFSRTGEGFFPNVQKISERVGLDYSLIRYLGGGENRYRKLLLAKAEDRSPATFQERETIFRFVWEHENELGESVVQRIEEIFPGLLAELQQQCQQELQANKLELFRLQSLEKSLKEAEEEAATAECAEVLQIDEIETCFPKTWKILELYRFTFQVHSKYMVSSRNSTVVTEASSVSNKIESSRLRADLIRKIQACNSLVKQKIVRQEALMSHWRHQD